MTPFSEGEQPEDFVEVDTKPEPEATRQPKVGEVQGAEGATRL